MGGGRAALNTSRTIGSYFSPPIVELTSRRRAQADLLRRTWLPERFTCSGQDAHNAYYFE